MATVTRDLATRDSVTSDPTPAGLPAAPDRLHRITSDIYHEMGRHGLIKRADRVILLDGFLVKKMTQGPKHILAVQNAVDVLDGLALEGIYARKEDPVALYNGPGGTDSEPEPDVVLVRGTKHAYADRLPCPNDIILAIEVADRSLRADREGLGRYAWFGIPCAWIVNLVNGTIEVYDRPMGARTQDARYGRSEVKGVGDEVGIEVDGRVLGRVAVSEIIP